MFGLSILDIIMVVAYFLWVFWVGLKSMKKIHNTEDFFLGGRKFGRLIATFTMFGQGTSSETAVGGITQVKQMGISGIMISTFPNFFVLPTYFFCSKWYRRLRILTMSDYYKVRYNSDSMAGAYAVLQAFYFIFVIGLGFVAMSKTIMAITPKPIEKYSVEQKMEYDQAQRLEQLENTNYTALSEAEKIELNELREKAPSKIFSYFKKEYIVIGLAIVILIYAVGGGLEAAAKTDVLQSILTLFLTVLFIPFGLMKINAIHGSTGVLGAFQTMHKVLPEMVFDIFGSPANAHMTWYLMLAMGLLTLPNVLCQANGLVVAGSAKDDKTARAGFVDGMIIKRFAGVMWGLIGMIILALYFKDNSDPDMMWGIATRDLLGGCGLGLAGLMIACLMSALMSSADAHMITVSGLLTDSVYKPFVPGKPEKHYVFVGRIFCGLYLVGGVIMAFTLDDFWAAFKYMMTINFVFAAAFLMGILWRKSNTKAAWASIIAAGIISFLLPVIALLPIGLRTNEALLKTNISKEIVCQYTATTMDVDVRNREIHDWDKAFAEGKAQGERPVEIEEGKKFDKVVASKERSIFWDSIIAEEVDGEIIKSGHGMLKADMLLLYCCGVPLEKLSFPMLETLRYVTQFLISFLTLIIVGLATKPMDKKQLDLFYAKLRTPSYADHDIDAKEMAKTVADPSRFDHTKLFPNSSIELNKWDKYEINGVLKILGWVTLIYLALFAVVKIGA